MDAFLSPNSKLRSLIETGAQADSRLCWTCGSCDFECPVNIATGRLRPQKIVRMANLGLPLELTSLAEIWYCLTCRRCAAVCPSGAASIRHFTDRQVMEELEAILG